ncbi:MAG: T9SS type A sorting domain-containing protein [Bacteroidota bacterium]
MKIKLLLICILISTLCNAQIVNIPDAVFKAKLLLASPTNQIASTEIPNIINSVTVFHSIDTNANGEIEQSEAALITYLNVEQSLISDLTGIEAFTNLVTLYCTNNQLTSLNVTQNTNLKALGCGYNQLTTLNVTLNPQLTGLDFSANDITTIDVSQNPDLYSLYCINAQLTSLDITHNPILMHLNCEGNNLTTLDVSHNPVLGFIYCSYNQITSIDVTQNSDLHQLWCYSNQLTTLLLKNNGTPFIYLYFGLNPNLQYICSDEDDVAMVQQKLTDLGYTNCHVNTYCSFVPGGNFYTIQGQSKYDADANGCDAGDTINPNLRFTITNGSINGSIYSNASGNYSIPVQQGSHTVTPVLENPAYYNVNPTGFVANFPIQASPLIHDFCVTPNGVHHDVEIALLPTNVARPGFDATYTIVYKNKGNQIENGSITLTYNDELVDFISANPVILSQGANSLSWSFTNLLPFETRTIQLVFNVNSPTEIPWVNIGDLLFYTANITPTTADEFLSDNSVYIHQTVFGSYDPNDITCAEGTIVGTNMIGKFVHYVVRFENTGTYPAENIVVRDMIDVSKFDVSSMVPLHSSHNYVMRTTANKVEFIFENINLPFDDANNDGYVAFKIKTKANLVAGNTFSHSANIYFDYNFPIVTNTYTTTIQNLGINGNPWSTAITAYPNPVKDVLHLQTPENVLKVEIYDLSGRKLRSGFVLENKIDLSDLKTGNYLIKVYTDEEIQSIKVLKE